MNGPEGMLSSIQNGSIRHASQEYITIHRVPEGLIMGCVKVGVRLRYPPNGVQPRHKSFEVRSYNRFIFLIPPDIFIG